MEETDVVAGSAAADPSAQRWRSAALSRPPMAICCTPSTRNGRGEVIERRTLPNRGGHGNVAGVKTSLTGIKPTGTPHIGNWLGAIRPGLRLAETYRTIYFIADYHALTSIRDPKALQRHIYDVAATWVACGLDPEKTILFRQSAVPEVFELTWVLCCLLATGQLERGHSYKDALDKGEAPNAGVFNYPALMAADVILYDANVVPIGKDQKQHMELARDVAQRLNHVFGEGTVVVPEALLTEAPLVPGLDGKKMSKSYGNIIPIFSPAKELKSTVMKIVTGSEPLDAPKVAEGTAVFEIYKAVAGEAKAEEMKAKLAAGGYGWGHAKEALFKELDAQLGDIRARYQDLRIDEDRLDAILAEGAFKARLIAHDTIKRVREATGIDREHRKREAKTVRLKPPQLPDD
jgi:tryptophanyl-tRNA synthetase